MLCLAAWPFLLLEEELEPAPRSMLFGFPPRMADTDELGLRACFWIADVMEMHSEMTREMGSTATVTGLLRYCMRGSSACLLKDEGSLLEDSEVSSG